MSTDHVRRTHHRRESESLFSWASAAAAASAPNSPPDRAPSDDRPSSAPAPAPARPRASAAKARFKGVVIDVLVLGVLAGVGLQIARDMRHGRIEDIAALLLIAGIAGAWVLLRWIIRSARK